MTEPLAGPWPRPLESKPYEDQPEFAAYTEPPLPEQRVLQTFCGT